MKISIITVNYNDETGLERTIRSVVGQSYSDKEFIVVDGFSKDGSVNVIRKYENNITKWISEPDTGIYNAMNKGIKMATGDYCVFMNAGDVFYSSHVLQEVEPHLRSGKDIYNGNAIYVKDGNVIEWYRKCHKDISTLHFYMSSICHQATFIKTSLLRTFTYDESLRMVSDWKFWLESICIHKASYEAINVDICCFDTGGMTTTQSERGLKERKKVLNEIFTAEEIEEYEQQSKKRNLIKYIREGLSHRFWLYYSRLFMIGQVREVYRSSDIES